MLKFCPVISKRSRFCTGRNSYSYSCVFVYFLPHIKSLSEACDNCADSELNYNAQWEKNTLVKCVNRQLYISKLWKNSHIVRKKLNNGAIISAFLSVQRQYRWASSFRARNCVQFLFLCGIENKLLICGIEKRSKNNLWLRTSHNAM